MSKHERLGRLMKIMILVRTRRNLRRRDLAEQCEVSVRTIQRDIDTLNYAGVPIFWSDNGYEIMSDFFLPPVNLSLEEALHLVVATKAFCVGREEPERRTIESAVSKIVARLPYETRCHLAEVLERPVLTGEDLMALRH